MASFKKRVKKVIYGTDTTAGKLFDLVLIITIFFSISAVLLESIPEYSSKFGKIFNTLEWIFTILFTLEYILRIYCIRLSSSYIFSFYGIIDLLSIVPSYLSLFFPGVGVLRVIRVLRVLRVFRILKLVQYVGETESLAVALIASKRKIFIFLFYVLNIVIILGSLMYMIEGVEAGFDSIPRSIYWAIVTLTTVGYGDISPNTSLGQGVAAIVMIVGYSIIAVPTGIVSAELNNLTKKKKGYRDCMVCDNQKIKVGSIFCSNCGAHLEKRKS
tara:strand:- start:270 stop:1085 length:816 start_codon:yes stop_codon:yes gene_type:complete